MQLEDAKRQIVEEVDARADALLDASHRIHANPELLFEERFASGLLADACEAAGLTVERGAYGLETAFAARTGAKNASGPTVAVLCEYDALPGIGHACGHNIIATAGLGAALAAAALVDACGGRLVVLGTPAEEGGGGKILMAQQGAFEGVDAAMMVHPADADLSHMDVIAVSTFEVDYHGQAAHAAAFPWKGRNALDAAVLGYNAVAALRQHIQPNERIHGIFTKGGDKPNIVPDHAQAHWYVRSPTSESLAPLKERVMAALEGATSAAGCTMGHHPMAPDYSDLVSNEPLVALYTANAARTGREVQRPNADLRVVGSTDMGNVSHLVPAIHPTIKVAPRGVSIHSVAFTEWAGGPDGDRAVLDGAKAMAMTVADLWLDEKALSTVRDAHPAGP